MILTAGLVGALFLSGCGLFSGGNVGESEGVGRAPDTIRTDFYDTIEANAQQIGIDYPQWNRAQPTQVDRVSCYIGDSKGRGFSYTAEGGGVADPQVTSDAMYAYWEEQGYSLGKIIPINEATGSLEIGATSSTGIRVWFRIGPNASQLLAKSDCSLHPSLTDFHPTGYRKPRNLRPNRAAGNSPARPCGPSATGYRPVGTGPRRAHRPVRSGR